MTNHRVVSLNRVTGLQQIVNRHSNNDESQNAQTYQPKHIGILSNVMCYKTLRSKRSKFTKTYQTTTTDRNTPKGKSVFEAECISIPTRSWTRQSSGGLGNSPEVWRQRLRS